MPKKTYNSVPFRYPVCLHDDCPRAATCLHQQAYSTLMKKDPYLNLINPQRCTKDGKCPHYRDSKPMEYARGFTNFQRKMYPDQYDEFKRILIRTFGRNPYYERRRGDSALSPREQTIVLEAARKVGVTADLSFDSYINVVSWYD